MPTNLQLLTQGSIVAALATFVAMLMLSPGGISVRQRGLVMWRRVDGRRRRRLAAMVNPRSRAEGSLERPW